MIHLLKKRVYLKKRVKFLIAICPFIIRPGKRGIGMFINQAIGELPLFVLVIESYYPLKYICIEITSGSKESQVVI